MNIFYLDNNPRTCAVYHIDKHVVKMVLETCQLLSTAHRILDGQEMVRISPAGRRNKYWQLSDARENVLYSATHINHPCAIWCRQSDANYRWLYNLLIELLQEYTFRYEKIHKCYELTKYLMEMPYNIPSAEFTEPPLAMPDECKIDNDAIKSYRNYYTQRKYTFASWKKRSSPIWWERYVDS